VSCACESLCITCTPVVCFGNINLSAPLMHRLAGEGIALVLLDQNGRFQARLEGACAGNVLLRRAQHQASLDESRTLVSRAHSVAGKIRNARSLLLRGAREARSVTDGERLRDCTGSRRGIARAAELR